MKETKKLQPCYFYQVGKCLNEKAEVTTCSDPCQECDWWKKDTRKADTQKLIEFLDDLGSMDDHYLWLDNWEAMLAKVKGIVISYPIILKALEEANKNIDSFITRKTKD